MAQEFKLELDKRRTSPNHAEVVHLIGDMKDKEVFVMDDMIDTGGSMINAAEAAIENGASSACALATHGLFSGALWIHLSRKSL